MGDFAKLLKDFEATCSALNIGGKVCTIESFDKIKMTASIKPLGKKRVGDDIQDWPIISNVPVNLIQTGDGNFIRPEYSRLDLVYAAWANRDIKGPLKGENNDEPPTLFSAENAVVMGSVFKTGSISPTAFKASGLLIGNDGAYIQFIKDRINMGSANANESFVLGDSQRTQLNNLKAQVDTLINILTSWVPVLTDGGTALKTLFTSSGLPGFPKAVFTNTLSDKIKGEK